MFHKKNDDFLKNVKEEKRLLLFLLFFLYCIRKKNMTNGEMAKNGEMENEMMAKKDCFPLFSTLERRFLSLSLENQQYMTDTERQVVVDEVKRMDDMTQELVYAIIRFYHLFYEQGSLMELPFQMKKNKQNLYRLDMNDFPVRLQRLLYEFVILHQLQTSQNKNV